MTVAVHHSHGGHEVNVDGFEFESESDSFTVSCAGPYARLVVRDRARGSLTNLRQRGLIADSPRVVGEARRVLSDANSGT